MILRELAKKQLEVGASDEMKRLKEFWLRLKKKDIKLYRKLRFRGNAALIYMFGPFKGKALVLGYKYYRKKLKLG